jgi:hypothetical protein
MKRMILLLSALLLSVVSFGQKNEKTKLKDCFELIHQGVIKSSPSFSNEGYYNFNKSKFYYFDEGVIKGEFKPSRPLIADQEEFFLYQLKYEMSCDDCVKFIDKQKGIFPGVSRLFLVWDQVRGIIDVEDNPLFGLDRKENLWFSPYSCHQIPYISKNVFSYICNLSCFEDPLPQGSYIFFSKVKKRR